VIDPLAAAVEEILDGEQAVRLVFAFLASLA
jgi:hypothetical protein